MLSPPEEQPGSLKKIIIKNICLDFRTATYGCKTPIVVPKPEKMRLENHLRRMLKIKWTEHFTSDKILALEVKDIEKKRYFICIYRLSRQWILRK